MQVFVGATSFFNFYLDNAHQARGVGSLVYCALFESMSTYSRSWEKELKGLRPIARDRRKWKELAGTHVPDGTTDFIVIAVSTYGAE
jgi:hypothetical protein